MPLSEEYSPHHRLVNTIAWIAINAIITIGTHLNNDSITKTKITASTRPNQ